MKTSNEDHRDGATAMLSGERNLRQLAARAGFGNIAALARAAHVDRHTAVWASRGERAPRRAVVARLASALGVDADVLVAIFADARKSK
jgi:transcriptional regulator with XRE-family HTH domain